MQIYDENDKIINKNESQNHIYIKKNDNIK